MAGLSKVKGSGLATGAATASLVGIDDNATSTAITIDASEQVGIGTITPDGKLHIDGTSTTVTGLVLEAGMDGDCRSVDFHNSDGNKRMGIVYDNTNIKLNITDRSENKLVTIGELTGDVTVGTGNLVIGTSGKGIDFSAATPDGTGTTGSEVLDDYEEGEYSWTITGNTSGSMTPKANYTKFAYTKIGRKVTVQGKFETSGTHTATGYLKFSLPFASANLTDQAGNAPAAFFLYRTGLANVYNPVAIVSDNISYCLVYYNTIANNEVTTLDGEDVDSSIEGFLSLTYMTT